ncbi:MAG: GyrI protein [Actinobacteria bacterium HGW-Actinobacteria-2]|nr:MAG: GyrI protein [Actinobacteria bacterium HGW-Actinobacteria-2]
MDHRARLQIGAFSRLTRVSVRMLRHYAEHGLLTPAEVDPVSGYRYYRPSQLATAEQIVRLRDAGFTVAEMTALLPGLADPATMSAVLAGQRDQLLRQQDLLHDRLAVLDRLIAESQEPPMSIDIRTMTLPAMTIASLRDVIADYTAEQQLWARFMPTVPPSALASPTCFGATFYDEEYQDRDVDVEIWAELNAAATLDGPVRTVPEQTVIATTLRGGYDQINAVCRELGRHVAENGILTGPIFNIYTVSPAQDPNPENWVTEVCLPVIG